MSPRNRLLFSCLFSSFIFLTPFSSFADISFLSAQGVSLVNASSKPIVLRGVNLGGWFVEEPWMMPFATEPPKGSAFDSIRDHTTLWKVLNQRFGEAGMEEIRTAFRSTWINDADFARIENAGFNAVRIPILYDLLDEPSGFACLDRAVESAGKHNLYVMLDLHGAPGRQSKEMHTGESGVNRLFKDEAMVVKTEEVWKRIAEHYRTNSVVAAYDLLNEPMGAADSKAVYRVQDQLYQAIRSVDNEHLIIVEDGYKGVDQMPSLKEMGWKNVILSVHSYDFDAKSQEDHFRDIDQLTQKIKTMQVRTQAPFYLGEFNVEPYGSGQAISDMVSKMQANDFSWSIWTYKTAMRGGGGGLWGCYQATKSIPTLDCFRDSKEVLLEKITHMSTDNFVQSEVISAIHLAGAQTKN